MSIRTAALPLPNRHQRDMIEAMNEGIDPGFCPSADPKTDAVCGLTALKSEFPAVNSVPGFQSWLAELDSGIE